MKRFCLLVFILSICCTALQAQKGNNQISIGPEVDLPIGSLGDAYKVGFGGTVKGLYGVGTAGQITLMSGYTSFSGKSGTTNGYSYADQKISIVPVLVGYRQNFNPLYVEPMLGMASYTTKVTGYSFNETRFTYGIGAGYAAKSLDFGLRFQSHEGASVFALRLAYIMMLGKK